MRIVLDTNCLIQSLGRYSQYRPVWESILSGENILCVSNEILDEYAEILERLFNDKLANVVIETILENPHTELIQIAKLKLKMPSHLFGVHQKR